MTDKPIVTILCSDAEHPVNDWIERWAAQNVARAEITVCRDVQELRGGDFLFLISCHQIVRQTERDKYRYTLVLHASDLPDGRGMSPHIWQILEGADRIVLTMLNAEDGIDTGDIWQQRELLFDGTELHDEINAKLFDAELELMDWALENCDSELPRVQSGEPSYYPKRTPGDSEIDVRKPLADTFDLLRVADPMRFPAFFDFRGQRYTLYIEKAADDE